MSSQSDDSSEEFFDAEDTTPNRLNQKKKSPKDVNEKGFIFPKVEEKKDLDQCNEDEENTKSSDHPKLRDIHSSFKLKKSLSSSSADDFVEPKISDRQRFRELRKNMQNDEDENIGNTLTPDSQNSSVEGVYLGQRTSHPFRILEQDTASIQSMTSLGRVGRILAGSIDPSCVSVGRDSFLLTKSSSSQQMQQTISTQEKENQAIAISETQSNKSTESNINENVEPYSSTILNPITDSNQIINLAEPDVIASTKLASKAPELSNATRPVVPPRRRKNKKKLSNSSSEKIVIGDNMRHSPIDNENKIEKSDSQSKFVNEDDDNKSIETAESAIESFKRELDKSFAISGLDSNTSADVKNKTTKSASLNRIYNSLGTSNTSINSKSSPTNSAKSNSAPGRVSSIDPNQGLNLQKATRGRSIVQPLDKEDNKAIGPSLEELERINAEVFGNVARDRNILAGTGTNSLGSGTRHETLTSIRIKNCKDRRKSAGDEELMKQINMYGQSPTDSNKQLTDLEILQQVPVKNLDTGEKFPLSKVDEKLPELKKEMNPLSFHIMRLTSDLPTEEDETVDIPADSVPADEEDGEFEEGSRLKKKTEKIRRFFGSTVRKTVDKAKSIASEVSHARHKEDVAEVDDVVNPEINIKIKASNTNKGPYEFTKLQHVQDLSGEHTGAVWCMKFSSCGRLLATAGQDKLLRIWVLKDAYPFFQDMRTKYNTDHQKSSPTPSQESLVSQSSSAEEAMAMASAAEKSMGPFMPKAFCTYSGHESDLLDVSWSKNYFILSSSMDKTVRLWHISRKECLCCFQHIDFVTAIAFHPRDDRYFLSGSLDGKFRLWNIPDKKVALWGEIDGETKLITAANFCANGKFAVIGSYDGRCIFYTTDKFKYHTQIHVRSTRGRNSTGRKISGIEPMPGEDKILVTSNDSRIRLYDLRDLNLSCKYKGYLNTSSQIKASFSHDGKYIIAGSENQCIFIWKTHHDYAKLSSVRRDRNDFWEGIKAHNATVTCAIFAPHPEAIIKPEADEVSSEEVQNYKPDPLAEQHKKSCGYVLVTADFSGAIKVFINKTKPKHSSLPYTAIMD